MSVLNKSPAFVKELEQSRLVELLESIGNDQKSSDKDVFTRSKQNAMETQNLTEEQWLQLSIWMNHFDMYGSYIPVKDNQLPNEENFNQIDDVQINNDMAPDKIAAETPLEFTYDESILDGWSAELIDMHCKFVAQNYSVSQDVADIDVGRRKRNATHSRKVEFMNWDAVNAL